MKIPCRNLTLDLTQTRVMAVVNVTPDSFSDGGKYYRPQEALARMVHACEEGAGVIDLGGESTRPGATPLAWEDEWARLSDVLAAWRAVRSNAAMAACPLSVDTYHPETARRACEAGVHIVNCVYAHAAGDMLALAHETSCALVLPCRSPEEWRALEASANARLGAQAARDVLARVMIDPMIGFSTTRDEDLALLGALPRLAALAPLCVGVSRKRLVKKLTGEKRTGKNLGGCLGAAVWCAMQGASLVRVHDVAETVQALRVAQAFGAARDASFQESPS